MKIHIFFRFGYLASLTLSASGLPNAPTVQIASGSVIGSTLLDVDSFKGIPYAEPPVGSLRLKPPQAISSIGAFNSNPLPRSCPQFSLQTFTDSLPENVLATLIDSPLFQEITDAGEDCLTINVQRPSDTTSTSRLPVLFWIFGGGFQTGSTQIYDGTSLIRKSVSQGKPIIFVSVNYRVGAFGFLGGSKILADNSSNLGLLDQRLGLQWVADNIASFGGDSSKVTLWGQSAGSISVFDQMVLYDGDNTYKGNPLFRAAIMDSGSLVPADPVDCPKAEVIYDQVVQNAGCASAVDSLECLRGTTYETLLDASNSVPGQFSYHSTALSYVPRPDGNVLAESPDLLLRQGKYASVPFIIGDQEDEGTVTAFTQSNITNTAELEGYLSAIFFNHASASDISSLVALYPDDPMKGSPFGTGLANQLYPEFKRIAALLGDLTFIMTRRTFLELANTAKPDVLSWSYLASYYHGTPILGTFHGSDILPTFGIVPGVPTDTIQSYYISFVNALNPSNDTGTLLNWPTWGDGKNLLNFQAVTNSLIADDFRQAVSDFLIDHITSFYL